MVSGTSQGVDQLHARHNDGGAASAAGCAADLPAAGSR